MADSIVCNWLDLRIAIEQTPQPLDFILPGLKSGTVGALVSQGGVGKTMFALQAAITIAGGADTLNLAALNWQPCPLGRVLYLSGEDPDEILATRIHQIGSRLSHAQRETLYERLAVAPLVGRGPDLMSPKWRSWITSEAANSRLIVIDTLRRFHLLDENDGGKMSELIAYLERLCRETSTTVMFLHHASKAGASAGGDAQQASRGSSVLTDNARFQANLVTMSRLEASDQGVDESCRRSFVRLIFAKLNYSAPLPDVWFRRREGGVLEPAVLNRPIKNENKRYNRLKGNAVSKTDAKGGDDEKW